MEQDGLRPAFARPQHVAVREAAASRDAREPFERNSARQQFGHVHVHRLEARAVEAGGHFHLAVHALLAQDSHARACARIQVRRRNVFFSVIRQVLEHAGVFGIGQRCKGFVGAGRVVTPALDLVAGGRPGLVQLRAQFVQQHGSALAHHETVARHAYARHRRAHAMQQFTQAMLRHASDERRGVRFAHCAHGAEFFVEQRRDGVGLHECCDIHVHHRMRRERHLGERHGQAAIGAVVVGHQQPGIRRRTNGTEERLQARGIVEVRRHIAQLAVHLREARAAEALLAGTKVQQEQRGIACFLRDVRRERAAHIAHRRKRRDNERHRRPHRLFSGSALFRPTRAHGQRVLADGNGDIQRRAQFHAHCANGVEQRGVLGFVAAGRHPVGRQFHVTDGAHIRCHDIGERLRHGHAPGGRTGQQRQRRPFAHRHGFTGIRAEAGRGDRYVRYRHLPGPDHGVAVDETTHAAVANGDEEGFICHRGQVQQAIQRFAYRDADGRQRRRHSLHAACTARHLRRLAEQHLDRQLHGRIAEVRVVHLQQAVRRGVADDGEWTTLTRAQCGELVDTLRGQHQHIAFLAFVAPQLERRHARLVVQDAAQIDAAAQVAVGHGFRHGIRKTTGAHIVDEQDGVCIAQRPAGVDDFLRAALHFRVATLHGGEVQVGAARAAVHGRSRTTTQADEHGRAAQHDDGGARRDVALLDVFAPNVAKATRQHDGLVVAAGNIRRVSGNRDFISAEIAEDARATEFVIEGGGPEWAFRHDVERRSDTRRLRLRPFPWLFETGDTQVRHGEAGEPRLGLRPAAGSAFVTDLAAGARGGARERRDGRGVVVRLHLHQDVDGLFVETEGVRRRVRPKPRRRGAFNDRSIVAVGREHARRAVRMRVADHGEQRLGLRLAVHGPVGVEDLVAAVFAVRLREHHQFHVRRVAFQLRVGRQQVVELVFGQGEAQAAVRRFERCAAFGHYRHGSQLTRRRVAEQASRGRFVREHGVRHAVVQQGGECFQRSRSQRRSGVQRVAHAAFHAVHLLQAAAARNIRGLAGPWGDGAETRDHEQRGGVGATRRRPGLLARSVSEQTVQHGVFASRKRRREIHHVHEPRLDAGHRGHHGLQAHQQLVETETGKGAGASLEEHQFFRSPPGGLPGGMKGMGNGATLPPSSEEILLTPCDAARAFTSSIRRMLCSGR